MFFSDSILNKNREPEKQYGLTDITLKLAIESKILDTIKTRITELTNDECKAIFRKVHWVQGGCEDMEYPLNLIHFDYVLDIGIASANKGLQVCINDMHGYSALYVNGFVDHNTKVHLSKLNADQPKLLQFCLNYLAIREEFYRKGSKRKLRYKEMLPDKLAKLDRLEEIVNQYIMENKITLPTTPY